MALGWIFIDVDRPHMYWVFFCFGAVALPGSIQSYYYHGYPNDVCCLKGITNVNQKTSSVDVGGYVTSFASTAKRPSCVLVSPPFFGGWLADW
jgi:hypothetical protein